MKLTLWKLIPRSSLIIKDFFSFFLVCLLWQLKFWNSLSKIRFHLGFCRQLRGSSRKSKKKKKKKCVLKNMWSIMKQLEEQIYVLPPKLFLLIFSFYFFNFVNFCIYYFISTVSFLYCFMWLLSSFQLLY